MSAVNKKRSDVVKIVLPVTVFLLALTSAGMYLVWICIFRGTATSLMFLQGHHRNNQKKMRGFLSASDELGDEDLDLPFVCFREIVAATNNFAEDNMLGQGGFGKVYKVTTQNFLPNHSICRYWHHLFNLSIAQSSRV
jgi:hypothetical protein